MCDYSLHRLLIYVILAVWVGHTLSYSLSDCKVSRSKGGVICEKNRPDAYIGL